MESKEGRDEKMKTKICWVTSQSKMDFVLCKKAVKTRALFDTEYLQSLSVIDVCRGRAGCASCTWLCLTRIQNYQPVLLTV